jgi:hypothetical protein
MSSTLQSLGFVRVKRGESVVFTYPNGGPVILLPAYKSGDAVKPIHRVMVEKQLMDSGIVKARKSPITGYSKAASRPAHKAKPPKKRNRKVEA